MSDDYLDGVERDTERLTLQTLIEAANADERALQTALSMVGPSVDWATAAPDKLPSPAGDPLAYQLAVTTARNDYLRSRWDALSGQRDRARERQRRTLDSYLGGGELSLDTLLSAAQAAQAAKPTPTLGELSDAGQARKDAERAANLARAAEIQEQRS